MKKQKENEKLLQGFSSGQDSFFYLFFLLHYIKQYNFCYVASYKSHDTQTNIFYTEFHCFKIFSLISLPFLNSLFFLYFSKKKENKKSYSELKLKEFRYDLWLRELTYYQYNSLCINHTQNDFFESKLVDFFKKSVFYNLSMPTYLHFNDLYSIWPKKTFYKTKKIKLNLSKFFFSKIKKSTTNSFQSRLIEKDLIRTSFKKNVFRGNFVQIILWKNKISFSQPILDPSKVIKKSIVSKKRLQTTNSVLLNSSSRPSIRGKSIFTISRPLKNLSRFQIVFVNKVLRLPNQNDHTNFLISYLHNCCRHEIIPILKNRLGSNLEKTFSHYNNTEQTILCFEENLLDNLYFFSQISAMSFIVFFNPKMKSNKEKILFFFK